MATPVPTDTSRSILFSTVTTPVTRLAIASARVCAVASATVPASVTTPKSALTVTSARLGTSAKMPEMRSAMRWSALLACVVSIAGAAVSCVGVGEDCGISEAGGAGDAAISSRQARTKRIRRMTCVLAHLAGKSLARHRTRGGRKQEAAPRALRTAAA